MGDQWPDEAEHYGIFFNRVAIVPYAPCYQAFANWFIRLVFEEHPSTGVEYLRFHSSETAIYKDTGIYMNLEQAAAYIVRRHRQVYGYAP